MSEADVRMRSLKAKLRGITVLLFLCSAVLISLNVYLLSGMRGNAAKQRLFGQGTSYAYQLLFYAQRFAGESGTAREHTGQQIDAVLHANEHRYEILLHGDPAHGIHAVADPNVRANLMGRVARWRNEFVPAIERLLRSSNTAQSLPALAALQPLLEDYADKTSVGAEEEQGVLTAQVERANWLQYMFALVVVLVIVAVVRLAQQISNRAESLADVARRIAGGEVGLRAPSSGDDELSVLGQAFNSMTESLHSSIEGERKNRMRLETLLSAINETAASLVSCSAELLAGTSEQAGSAQTQAVAVTQTVTTVNQALKFSDRAAQQARLVAEVAQRSVTSGQLGGRALANAITRMAELQEQSESAANAIVKLAECASKIDEVTFSISEIAEQTHLLSLNAGIEAVRAGEHGKTFSIVANQVKVLAAQCKEANTQVRQLLSEIQPAAERALLSAEDASKGVESAIAVVDEASETMRSLLRTIEQAAHAAHDIANSARQQSAGMEQIHVAMKSVSRATDQNVSSVKQAERAAQELSRRGVDLKKLIAS